ncbi:Acetyltransferase (GNAT) family [Legionella steigerwaltii]|uniref:Acetyltransferase (GNAT) family n=1 Tax=Legionella steigerwaltii TaxID=460 RepID=A0A378LI60_9GAMM|nr:GNAT family N-acetyltransferase [Legionella steigerwaltii]KTD71633.1 Acetyltransferase (GNAT) family protein [Legionella steigerwaltii]STY23791.1 Acetyltransferase (GNAT) family [Legionella steigerwaltii]
MEVKVDDNVVPSSTPHYVLDYPNKNDFSVFLAYVNHESAMAEIYFESVDGNETLDDVTVKLFNKNGKLLHKDGNRCDLMLVLRDKGEVIGFIELRLAQNSEQISQLFSLFVREDHRRRGLANLMMDQAFNFFTNTGQTIMTVSPTADSLAVYNKFAFYPPDLDDDGLRSWFQKTEKERLEGLKDEPSEYLIMDLEKELCQQAFESHREKSSQSSVEFELSQNLRRDSKINVFEWRKVSLPTLSNSDLGVLSTPEVPKKRKAESQAISESEQKKSTLN